MGAHDRGADSGQQCARHPARETVAGARGPRRRTARVIAGHGSGRSALAQPCNRLKSVTNRGGRSSQMTHASCDACAGILRTFREIETAPAAEDAALQERLKLAVVATPALAGGFTL